MTYEQFLDEVIVKPLGLSHTGCYNSLRLPANVAIGYEKDQEGWRSNYIEIPLKCTGDGGLYTCVSDLERLWQGIMSEKLLSAKTRDEALKVQVVIEGNRCYGLGFYILLDGDGKTRTYALVGQDPGVSFLSRYYVEDRKCMSILSNTSYGAWRLDPVINDLLM